jgi:hypothetical protein
MIRTSNQPTKARAQLEEDTTVTIATFVPPGRPETA